LARIALAVDTAPLAGTTTCTPKVEDCAACAPTEKERSARRRTSCSSRAREPSSSQLTPAATSARRRPRGAAPQLMGELALK